MATRRVMQMKQRLDKMFFFIIYEFNDMRYYSCIDGCVCYPKAVVVTQAMLLFKSVSVTNTNRFTISESHHCYQHKMSTVSFFFFLETDL